MFFKQKSFLKFCYRLSKQVLTIKINQQHTTPPHHQLNDLYSINFYVMAIKPQPLIRMNIMNNVPAIEDMGAVAATKAAYVKTLSFFVNTISGADEFAQAFKVSGEMVKESAQGMQTEQRMSKKQQLDLLELAYAKELEKAKTTQS